MDLSIYKENPKTAFLASEIERLLKQEADVLAMTSDPSMKEMADEELETIRLQKESLLTQIESIVKEEKEEEKFPNEIVLEVRAGAGGDEAALFAEQLASMYRKYAAMKGWQVKVLDESKNSIGGYKEASFEIKGREVYR